MKKGIIAGMAALTAGSLLSSTFQASSLPRFGERNTALGTGVVHGGAQNSLKAQLGNESNLTKPKLLPFENSKDGFISRFEDPNANRKIVERLKNRLKDARANTKKIVEGENFSKMDLRDFDLNGLGFEDCNFSGAKFPSLDSVIFYNSCNLENADFSNIVLKKVNFGDRIYENQINELISNIGRNQLLINEISQFNNSNSIKYFQNHTLSRGEIQSNIEYFTEKTKKDPKILRITNANFAGTKFKNFWLGNSDFSGSNFNNAEIRIDQASISDVSIRIPSASGLDLTGAIFEFYDNRGKKIQQTRGTKQLNLKSTEGLKERIGFNGVGSAEFYEKWKSDKEITILINANNSTIPPGLRAQDIDKDVSPQLVQEFTAQDNIDYIEKEAARISNIFYAGYNIKFVTKEMSEAKNADYNLHFNFINTKITAGTEFFNFFALGNKDHVVFMNINEIREDFWAVFLHEMTHMFFQDPVKQSDLFYPAKISYLPPMANGPNENGAFKSMNMIPMTTSILEQELIQKYMSLLGRKREITDDLTIDYKPEAFGIRTSYNTNENVNNIIQISSKDLDDKHIYVVMDGERALSYCTTSDPYKCHPAKGLEDSQALLAADKKTGVVLSMIMLKGKNPLLKIDNEHYYIKDFMGENIYSILRKDSQGKILCRKINAATDLISASVISDGLVEPDETLVNQDEERPQNKPKSTTENLVASKLVNDPENLEKKLQPTFVTSVR